MDEAQWEFVLKGRQAGMEDTANSTAPSKGWQAGPEPTLSSSLSHHVGLLSSFSFDTLRASHIFPNLQHHQPRSLL